MTILAHPNWKITQLPPGPVRRFTVAEYHRMIQSGVLTEDDAVELLEGWIVLKMPRSAPHDVTIDLAREAVERHLPQGWRLRVQSAITTADSEPEPDLAVVRGPARRYVSGHPESPDITFVVEVSGSSLDYDRDVKGRIYAAAEVPVYWIINLVDGRVEVYTGPAGGAYAKRDDFAVPRAVPLVFDGQTVGSIPVRDLLA